MYLCCTSCVLLTCAGGRISDSFDQRVLTTYLEEYFGDFLFDTFQPFRFYVGRDGDSIGLPPTGSREVYVKAIDALPLVQSPEVRGRSMLMFNLCVHCL
jgi:dynein heavy chain